jgi:hypothetical protein
MNVCVIYYNFNYNVTDLRGLLAALSLEVALPLLRLDMVSVLFFILDHEFIKEIWQNINVHNKTLIRSV